MITVTRRGPILERPDRNSRTLATAYEGMGLKLLEIDGEWFKVEFVERPSGTPRIGYVHVDYVRAIPRR